MMSSFKAYIGVEEYDLQDVSNEKHESFDEKKGLKLLPGEVVVSSACGVLKFTPLNNRQGVLGKLFVTNFKLGYIAENISSYELVDGSPKNKFLGECDVCLANIDSIYQVLESGRKKKLVPGSNVSSKVELLQVDCKNFRVQTFSFKFTTPAQSKAITNALLHYAFPPRVQLVFAFEYKEPAASSVPNVLMFKTASDWSDELQRLKGEDQWRVSHMNENFMVCKSLPETFVVPRSILDKQLDQAARFFQGNRIPTWCWSQPDGRAIVRSAGIHPGTTDHQHIKNLLEQFSQHNQKQIPRIADLDMMLPSLKDIQQSYQKLRELCIPDSISQFWEQDNHYYNLLDGSKWLQTVAACLDVAKSLATHINRTKNIIILQEATGRDMTCVISSLMQIILDPHYRTIVGFQSLVQKEWVAMGHPFSNRLKLLRDTESEECPYFLIFLDCVWQMLQQFPSSFEFSEFYLTMLWDCTHLTVFDTFLFNSSWGRYVASKDELNHFRSRSLWNWTQLYSEDDLRFFRNPLFVVSQVASSILEAETSEALVPPNQHRVGANNASRGLPPPRPGNATKSRPDATFSDVLKNSTKHNTPSAKQASSVAARSSSPEHATLLAKWLPYKTLPVNAYSSALQMWSHCYLRWISPVQIYHGGSPAVYLQRCGLVKDILQLESTLGALSSSHPSLSFVNDAYQIRLHSSERLASSSFPYSPGGSPPVVGLPLSVYRHSKYVASDNDLNLDYPSLD